MLRIYVGLSLSLSGYACVCMYLSCCFSLVLRSSGFLRCLGFLVSSALPPPPVSVFLSFFFFISFYIFFKLAGPGFCSLFAIHCFKCNVLNSK
jgi:hypothetical protein